MKTAALTWADVERLAHTHRDIKVRAAAKEIVTKFHADMCPERGNYVLWYMDRGNAFDRLRKAVKDYDMAKAGSITVPIKVINRVNSKDPYDFLTQQVRKAMETYVLDQVTTGIKYERRRIEGELRGAAVSMADGEFVSLDDAIDACGEAE